MFFPEPKEIDKKPVTVWDRWRVVVPCFDREQAERIAEQVSEFVGGSVENFQAFTVGNPPEVISEALLSRKHYLLKDRTATKPESGKESR